MNPSEQKNSSLVFQVSESALDSVAAEILSAIPSPQIGCFYGDLGSGKTTLIKAFCRSLEVREKVTSPTFSLVQEYRTLSGEKVYHLDLYRIKTTEELLQIGIEEILDEECWIFIEWPQLAIPILPLDHFIITLDSESERIRKIVFSLNES